MDIIDRLKDIRREILSLKANKRINFEQLSYVQKSTSFSMQANGFYTIHAVCTPINSSRLPVVDYSMDYVPSVYPQPVQWVADNGRVDMLIILTSSGRDSNVNLTVCGFNLKDVKFSVSKTG